MSSYDGSISDQRIRDEIVGLQLKPFRNVVEWENGLDA